MFGSARTEPGEPEWRQAREFAEKIVQSGWMVITGAGDGIMGAAQGGAGRERSFGVNIRLPFEQAANSVIAGDQKLVNFRYFFTRKVTFVKESHAIALFPGGFGTHDEGFESLTLIQTGKINKKLPIVLFGTEYWDQVLNIEPMVEWGTISPEDVDLIYKTDSVDDAYEHITSHLTEHTLALEQPTESAEPAEPTAATE